jgi:multiple sugar transport system permease protein
VGDALAGARGDLGRCRRHDHHLPGRADQRPARAVRRLRGVLLITLILQVIGTAQVFLEPYLFTGGGPNNATVTVLLLIYRYAFQNSLGGDYGAATALSLMLAAFLAVLSLVYFRLTRSWSTS